MSRRLPSLMGLRAFEAAGRHLNFSAAARELSVTPSAISHHVRRLEDELALALFVRGTRTLALTEAGTTYLARISSAFQSMADATRALRSPVSQVLNVSLLSSFATTWLIPRMGRFNDAHPEIEVRLNPGFDLVNFSTTTDCDLAIRYGRGGWPGVKSTLLMYEHFAPVCSPSLIAAEQLPLHPDRLRDYPLLVATPQNDFEWNAWAQHNGTDVNGVRKVTLHDYNMVLQAVLNGQGMAIGRRAMLSDLVRNGKLVEAFGPLIQSDNIGYWLVTREEAMSPQAAIFAAWLSTEMTAFDKDYQ